MTSRSRRPGLNGVLLAAAPFVLTGCFDCEALERARVRAPRGDYEAVRWIRECGTLYQGDIVVTIVPVGEEPTRDPQDYWTVFRYTLEMAEGVHNTSDPSTWPNKPDSIRWVSDRELHIAYDARWRVVNQVAIRGDLRLSYNPY